MSLLTKMQQFGHGASNIAEWLGDGGDVVDDCVAQERANICLACPMHDSSQTSKVLLGAAVRRVLEIKNKIGLRVENEDKLGTCRVCGCVLKLQIFEPDSLVTNQSEKSHYAENCWKTKL